jgi:hypothetical protein
MSRHLTKKEHSAQKAALTRAINSGDPEKVVAACRSALRTWEGKAWPDDWSRWNIALWDARGMELYQLDRYGTGLHG